MPEPTNAGTNVEATLTDVPQSLIDTIESTLNPKADVETVAPDAAADEAAANVAAGVARRKANAKEEADELVEEGLQDPNNPEGLRKKPAVEATDEEEVAEEPVEAAAEGEQAPELDATLRYIANQQGWTDDKINRLMKADPELAQETFQSLADAYTNLSRQLLAPAAAPVAPVPQQAVQTAQTPASRLDLLAANLQQFAETNGQEIVDQFLKPFLEERKEQATFINELRAHYEVQQRQAVATEAETTFTSLATNFGDLYGKDGTVSQAQQVVRERVAQVADQLRAGAKLQGRQMSVDDALRRAHLIFTADRQQETARRQVQEQVQKRSKQITARPTQRKSGASTGVRSENQAAEAYARKAAELGIEV